jgi:rare lipoprotein A
MACQAEPCSPEAGTVDASSASKEQRPSDDLEARYQGHVAGKVLLGKASYYADSLAGNRTASGEVYDPKAFTAAHRTLKFGTVVRVVRPDTGASVTVRITDRGPFAGKRQGRIIDLSRAAAERLQMLRAGVVTVRVEVLE